MSIFESESWPACREDLCARYQAPGRYYHTLRHIEDCLSKLELVSHCDNREAIQLAIWFHDAVYDAARPDNEEVSAQLADEWLKSIAAPLEFREESRKLIIVTDHKTIPRTEDEKLIVDIDLSILGSSEMKYDQYALNIRKEYAVFSDKEYSKGRRKVLNYFLNRPFLYLTEVFREKFEDQAKRNLSMEIARLNSHSAN